MIVPVVASVASVVIIASALVTFFVLKRKKSSNSRGITNLIIFTYTVIPHIKLQNHINIFVLQKTVEHQDRSHRE